MLSLEKGLKFVSADNDDDERMLRRRRPMGGLMQELELERGMK
jgi:hypothetical protein